MKIPRPIFLTKIPFVVQCPACSETFGFTELEGKTRAEMWAGFERSEADYEKHFRDVHGKED